MFRNYTYLSLVAALAVTGCSTTQHQSPYYNSNPATGAYSTSQAPAYTQQASTYSTSTNTAALQDCRRKETNRELIGGAVGGTAGAFVGKELIGGTKGVVAGAALGGIAGYGIGDISTNCSPATQTYSGATQSNAGYQSATSYSATPAGYNSVSCPAGTISQSNGTCLLESSLPGHKARTVTAAPTTSYQQYDTGARTGNVVTANTLMTPSPHLGTEVTRRLGGSSYQVNSGDTVYSLARKHCVSVKDIQSANGLDSNYGIQIGQTLQLPANRC